MTELLTGVPVASSLTEKLIPRAEFLKQHGIVPCLAILRVGSRADDMAYERGAIKRCEKVGIAVRLFTLPPDVSQDILMRPSKRSMPILPFMAA